MCVFSTNKCFISHKKQEWPCIIYCKFQNELITRGKPQIRSTNKPTHAKKKSPTFPDWTFPDLKVSELYGSVVKLDIPDGFPYITNDNHTIQQNAPNHTSHNNHSFVHGVDFSCRVWQRQNYPFWQYNRRRPNVVDPSKSDRPRKSTSISDKIPDILDGPGTRKRSSNYKNTADKKTTPPTT